MEELTEEEQLEAMKIRADDLGVEYAHNIGLETLTERVEAAEAEAEAETNEDLPVEDAPRELTGAEALAINGDY